MMSLLRRLLFYLLLFAFKFLPAQTIIIPHQIDVDVNVEEGEEKIESVIFFQYPYSSEVIDLKAFKRKLPKLIAPDNITIEAPDLSEFQTVHVLLGLLTEEKMDSNAIVIWLAGDYYSSEVTFFTDPLMDRNYRNDGAPVVLKEGQSPVQVMVYPFGNQTNGHELLLQVPRRPKLKGFSPYGDRKIKIGYQFALGFHASFGSGSLTYQFDNLERGFPTWYSVNFSQKSLGLSMSYSLPRFRLGLSATLQNHFYYTSYLNIRFDNPTIKINPITGERIRVDNVLIERNQDVHSKNQVQWAIFGAYRMHLSETLELQPFLSAGKTTFLSGEYIADRRVEDQTYKLPSSSFAEAGIQAEVTTGLHKAFFIGIFYNKVWWEPEEFYQSIEHENLGTSYYVWKGRLGYRIAFK